MHWSKSIWNTKDRIKRIYSGRDGYSPATILHDERINTTVFFSPRYRQEFCRLRGRYHRLGCEETGWLVVAGTAWSVRADHEQRRMQEDGIRRKTNYGQHDVCRISGRQKGFVPSKYDSFAAGFTPPKYPIVVVTAGGRGRLRGGWFKFSDLSRTEQTGEYNILFWWYFTQQTYNTGI